MEKIKKSKKMKKSVDKRENIRYSITTVSDKKHSETEKTKK